MTEQMIADMDRIVDSDPECLFPGLLETYLQNAGVENLNLEIMRYFHHWAKDETRSIHNPGTSQEILPSERKALAEGLRKLIQISEVLI